MSLGEGEIEPRGEAERLERIGEAAGERLAQPPEEHFGRLLLVELLADGMISADDIELLRLTDDPDAAVEHVLACYERRRA